MKSDSVVEAPPAMSSGTNGLPPAVLAARAEAVSLAPQVKLDRRFVSAALMLVMVLASMEQTVTSTAMPTIIGELHGLEHYSCVASIYLLTCTVSMPLYGRLADALGRKPVILLSIAIFSVGSMFAASAHTMGQLILYRGMQGLGAGGIMPVVLTILGDLFTLKERARIQGLFSGVWGVASLAGPALGALLVNTLGWRSIFFVNLPFGILGISVLVWKYHDHEKPHSTDLDLPGVSALALACAATLALVSRLGPGGWPAPVAVGLLVVAVATTIYFIRHERRAANPIMPPALMAQRAIGPSMAGNFLLGIGFLSLDTFVPLYVQGGRGGGVAAAAGVVTPVMLTWALSGFLAAPLLIRWGFRRTALLGCSLIVVGFSGLVICALVGAPHQVLTAVLAITGFGFGPASMSYLLAAQDAVTWQQRGMITSSTTFFRTIGGAIGIGLLGMLFNVLIAPDFDRLKSIGVNPAKLMDPRARDQIPAAVFQQAQDVISHGLTWVFIAMLVIAAVAIFVTLFMSPRKCDHPVSKAEALESLAG